MSLTGDDEDTAIGFRESFPKAERAILQRFGFLKGPGTVVSLHALLITLATPHQKLMHTICEGKPTRMEYSEAKRLADSQWV
jgi:hypothetical protein